MTQSQKRRLATIFFIQIFLISTSLAACPTIFYAKQIDFNELKKLDFYHTQLNVQTASECANVCTKKQFCRTAVYNHEAKTCAASFDIKIDCLKSRERYNDFFLTATSSTPLSIITCIDRCKNGELQKPLDFAHEKSGEDIEKPEKSEHSPKFSVHFTTPKDSDLNNIITSSSDETTFTPQPIIITEDNLKSENKTVKMIPQPLGFEAATSSKDSASASSASDGSHNDDDDKSDSAKVKTAFKDKEPISESSTTKSLFTTTTEPIVVNGKVLSLNAVRELVEYERTSTTTTTTPRPIILTTEEGFMNTFVISGVGDIFKEALADRNNQGQGHLSPELSTDATASESCYRTISQQLLYRAAFEKLGGRVSMNDCRCACARTWENSETKPKCKSLQYNEITGECSLNQDDHTGKYDLISHKDVDYHYISCELSVLLDTTERMCGGSTTKASNNKEVDSNKID
uniref:Apple domain-containing protein n=1 Tax=Panagrolaimus sp. ES5 TaxID=591445 RepID=A0AC34FNW7_9BILA